MKTELFLFPGNWKHNYKYDKLINSEIADLGLTLATFHKRGMTKYEEQGTKTKYSNNQK